jgi:hypothetical protein
LRASGSSRVALPSSYDKFQIALWDDDGRVCMLRGPEQAERIFKPFFTTKLTVLEWDYPLPVPLLKLMLAAYGLARRLHPERFFNSHC